MSADRRVDVPLARDLDPRFDHVAHVHDSGCLLGFDEVDRNLDHAWILHGASPQPLHIDREGSRGIASRRAGLHPLDRKASQLKAHHRDRSSPSVSANSVGASTRVRSASKQRSTIRRRNAASPSWPSDGSPQTCSILTPLITRFPPAWSATGGNALTIAVGMPCRSISLLIVAPQRLHD